ncbi:hypothetical protein J6590_084454 [Homalodisca vitripennis]|nr:hypothetical protein J6590_084454 [Homalodisca vitripennis]
MFGIYRYCSALPPLFLFAWHDRPIEHKREELMASTLALDPPSPHSPRENPSSAFPGYLLRLQGDGRRSLGMGRSRRYEDSQGKWAKCSAPEEFQQENHVGNPPPSPPASTGVVIDLLSATDVIDWSFQTLKWAQHNLPSELEHCYRICGGEDYVWSVDLQQEYDPQRNRLLRLVADKRLSNSSMSGSLPLEARGHSALSADVLLQPPARTLLYTGRQRQDRNKGSRHSVATQIPQALGTGRLPSRTVHTGRLWQDRNKGSRQSVATQIPQALGTGRLPSRTVYTGRL